MRKNYKILLAAMCVTMLILISGCSTNWLTGQPYQEGWSRGLPGSYDGVIVSGGNNCDGVTRIYRLSIFEIPMVVKLPRIGTLAGDYEFLENGNKISGTLYDFQAHDPLVLKCKWRDKYGTGSLEMLFSEDVAQFAGQWGVDGYAEKFGWNGGKKVQ